MAYDSLVDELVSRADDWARQRDQDNRQRWREYYRVWRGEWSAEDMNRESERSRVIMPSTSQAIDSAVSDVIEALWSKEEWISTGVPMLDDILVADLWRDRPNMEEAILLGALYGTIVSKIVVDLDKDGRPALSTQALHPEELIVDPAATSLDESLGVGHHVFVPRWTVEKRMRDGIYKAVALESSGEFFRVDPGQSQPRATDYIELMEWHGLIPIEEVEARQRTDQLKESAIGEDSLVEAVCTIANKEIVLRCEANPFNGDRPFVAAQWHTVPRRIWGRGIAESAYWPQKAIDAEMRARIDALAFSTAPMMAVSASQVPRSERFTSRPGRNIFVRGDVRTAMAPVQFAGPDPGTYQQTVELQRMLEMATGQVSQVNPMGDMSRTGSGPLSAVLGASVKRSARTMMNIERDYVVPLIEKAVLRMNMLEPEKYPKLARRPKINSGIGIMMRELENQQLVQLMQMTDGPAQLEILRMIVEGASIRDKTRMLQIIDDMVERAMAPEGMTPQDELVMAKMQQEAEQAQQRMMIEAERMNVDKARAMSDRERDDRQHQRDLIRLSIDAQKLELQEANDAVKARLEAERIESDRIKAEAAAKNAATLSPQNEPPQTEPANNVEKPASVDVSVDMDAIKQAIADAFQSFRPVAQEQGPVSIERDNAGLITSVNGRPVRRNSTGLIEGIE